MNHDLFCPAQRGRRRFDWSMPAAMAVLAVLSAVLFQRQSTYEFVDFHVHMNIAGSFDFADLHTITSRLAYPMWHLLVAVLYQLGLPLAGAAIGVTVACKLVTYLLAYWMIDVMSGRKLKGWVLSLLTLALLVLTGLWIPQVAPYVYKGIGSPNVWHNPTQLAVTAAMLMVMPWLCHCWYAFEHRLAQGEENITLPWWKIIVLAVLCMGSLACKPTFMQALLPAAFVMYLVELIRHRRQWRYFGQIILAFVPAAAYFLLQYLYYTGVVVEYTSGVEIGVTLDTAWKAIRNSLMMSACPLAALAVCWRKGMLKDRSIVLALLMTLFSVVEAMMFRETGAREGHGNFTWAANSTAFYLWVVMAGTAVRCFMQDRKDGMTALKKSGYVLVGALLAWHVASGIYYISYLLTTANAF